MVGWFGLTALSDSLLVYIVPSHREGEKREMIGEREKSKQPPPTPTASTVTPCPTISQRSRKTRGVVGWCDGAE